MRSAKSFALAALLAATGCHHHSSSNSDGGTKNEKPDLLEVVHSTALTVDGYENGFNTPYISITVCAPGTTNCATIDHVIVDTGSVGLRIPNATLQKFPTLAAALPTAQVNGSDLSECYIYAAGYFYGSIRSVDVQIAGERANAIPVQIGGDLTAPTSCSQLVQGAQEVDSPSTLGGDAIIGVMGNVADCGDDCTASTGQGNPRYFNCSGSTCTIVAVPIAQQVPQPIAQFEQDNNGFSLQLGTVDDNMGASSVSGTMTFGIGTHSDNDIPSGTNVYQTPNNGGLTTFTAKINSSSYPLTIFDSGSSLYFGTISSLTACTGQQTQGLYCPSSLQTISATITDSAGKSGTTTMKIANADTIFQTAAQTAIAFDDLAADGSTAGLPDNQFIMGLTHFFGRTIYVGLDGKTAGSNTGPFYGIAN